MTRWLQAAVQGLCQTDRTDNTDRTPDKQAITARKPANLEVPSVLSVCQFDTEPTCQTANATPLSGWSPEVIRQGVAQAFEDYEAMNDPHDPRAWA